MTESAVENRLIIALDVPTIAEADTLVEALGDQGRFYKIGYQLLFNGGLDLAARLKAAGKSVFIDAKLLDIDNTIAKGVAAIADLGVDMLTIHAYPNAMKAAVDAAAGSALCLLGVTVLTSMEDADLTKAGYACDAAALVAMRARQAAELGMGGIVCSAREAAQIRAIIGPEMAIVTPGIRPSGAHPDDQKRIVTPYEAVLAGASHLVVGRPIVQAEDPANAAAAIVTEIASAL